ncbi:DNA cytosine methyltransferase [Elizabethkingia anophelis]|uniref:DNA cytosine methyltransferase n=1 Tax=Elizabethkingia anophelis TaxID=1117645 RepID=UPI0016263D8D
MKLIELFSGIGGFTKGLQDAGFEIEEHYFSEIDKHSIANYKYNFPHAKHIGSVTDISGRDFKGIDIITFGSPCQDFSIAGNGEGLGGKRSVLILEAIRLVTEIRPPVFIWENVKGAFSSNSGADFWAIIQAFANIGGYRLEWQLLNTKWVLPQNRERIYLIGHLDGRSKPGVFPFSEDNFGFNERSIETTNIRTLTAGGHSGGLHSSMTLISSFGINEKQKLSIKENANVANCLTSRMHKDFKENMIQIKSATKCGHELATEGDSINFSNPKSKTRRGRVGKNIAQTLDCGCNQAVMIGAIRGRNPENPKSIECGLSTEQMLEINENGCSNTLTSVQKDNVVVSYSMGSAKPGRVPEIFEK